MAESTESTTASASSPPGASGTAVQPQPTWTPSQELGAKLVFGGIGCMVAVVFTNPVDVIKTRLQLQGEHHGGSAAHPHAQRALHPVAVQNPSPLVISVSASAPHSQPLTPPLAHTTGFRTAHSTVVVEGLAESAAMQSSPPKPTLRLLPLLRDIVRNEGPRVLLAGLAPAVLRESIYSTIRFGSYDLFKGLYSGMGAGLRGGEETSTMVKLGAGLTSGMVGSVIANPTDLIKVRLQAHSPSGKPRYHSIADACRSIYIEEGLPGLYRGVVPTAARAMVVTASQLASYDTTKHWLLGLKSSTGQRYFSEGYGVHFLASTIAGLVCSISTSPIDTVKVRYMNQQFNAQGKGNLYSSALDCVIKTMRNEGPLALYKGFLACWMRLGPHTLLSLMIFEKLRSLVGMNPV
ncbi:hypothetical protein DFQ27_008275 [Actinomortierella ambigua]|uniref:Mitochondrial carrier n=1 Tax=Actinomortierella ambigua TaxID=1343610 RepID=A0A9P6QH40_9FUNG|nr:hypothetical protein DFQ27_008275 [Actinomortierella ambigua]